MGDYVIKKGDTLSKIVMQQYGVKGADVQKYYTEIAKINGIKDPNLIFAGKTLKLPEDVFQTTTQNNEVKGETTQLQTKGAVLKDEVTPANEEKKQFSFNPDTIKNFMSWTKEFRDLKEDYNQKIENLIDLAQNSEDMSQQKLNAQMEAVDKEYSDAFIAINSKFNFNIDDTTYENSLKNIAQGTVKSFGEKDGLSFDGFLNWYTGMLTTKELANFDEAQFRQTFDKLDKDNSRLLDADELTNMYKALDGMDKKEDGELNIGVLTDTGNFDSRLFS